MDEHNLFTTKGYVLMLTITSSQQKVCVNIITPIHLQEVCSHWELKQYEGAHFQYHFTLFFIWIQSIKPFKSKIIICTWKRVMHSFHHLHLTLLTPSFLQLPFICNCTHLFTIAKWKFTKMVTPNTLETMIEYTLISSILDIICKMTTKPLEYPRYPTLLEPLKNLLQIKTWGT